MYQTLLEAGRRRKSVLLAVAIVVACIWIGVRVPRGLADLQEKHRLIRQLTEQNAAIKAENDRRQERIRKLETSPSEQEIEIRKQLKLMRPGETTFILQNAPAATSPDTGSTPRP